MQALFLLTASLLAPQLAQGPATTARRTIAPLDRVLWRFPIASHYIYHRPAIAPDGTLYVSDIGGTVTAIDPRGGLRWTFDLGGLGAQGPCAVGADGTLYVVGDPGGLDVNLYALRPDGSVKWVFNDVGAQGVIAGPAVGPDGNIYFVNEFPGAGLISLRPDGTLRWAHQTTPGLFENGQLGAELAFGSSTTDAHRERVFVAFDMLGMGTGPRLFGFDLAGSLQFSVATGGQTDPFLQPQCQPVGGPDGRVHLTSLRGAGGWTLETLDPDDGSVLTRYAPTPANGMSPPTLDGHGNTYLVRSLSFLSAVAPSGDELWSWSDGSVLDGPVVSPDGSLLVLGGRPSFGQPGFFAAFTADGRPLWRIDLPREGAGALVPDSRAAFSPTRQVAYIAATNPSGGTSAPSYVYALDTSP